MKEFVGIVSDFIWNELIYETETIRESGLLKDPKVQTLAESDPDVKELWEYFILQPIQEPLIVRLPQQYHLLLQPKRSLISSTSFNGKLFLTQLVLIPAAFGYTFLRHKIRGAPKFVRTRAGVLSAGFQIASTLIFYLTQSIMASPAGKAVINKFIEEKLRGKKYWTRNITPNHALTAIVLPSVLLSYFLFVWWNAKFVLAPLLVHEIINMIVPQFKL